MTINREDLDAGRIDLSDVVDPAGEPPAPIHPGEILRDTLEARGVTAFALAKAMRVPVNRLTAIMDGRRAITADTAIRLGKALGTSAELWLGLQADYDLEVAMRAGVGEDVRPLAA